MDGSHIAQRRLANQGITSPRFGSPEAVVGWLGAVQAQEYDVAKWSLGQRAIAETDVSVERALAEGRILRTHALRPTWHFVLPADIRWLLGLTAPLTRRMMSYYDQRLELDAATYHRSNALIEQALSETPVLTRSEVAALLAVGGIEASGQRLAHLMFDAELSCLVCSGPRRGKQQTYALLSERAPNAKSLTRDESLAELARRFFSSHGPATSRDFASWTGLTIGDARRALAMLGSDAESCEVDGRTYWRAGEQEAAGLDTIASQRAHLLQGYDEYIMGYSESRDVFGYGGRGTLPPGWRPMTHAVIVDGLVAGHWRRTVTPKLVTVDLQLYRQLRMREHDDVEAAVERYGAFAGVPAAIGGIEQPAG
jgi:hypothetical protein